MQRRKSKQVMAGNVAIGGDARITVQSMLNIPAQDVEGSVRQAAELEKAGCDIIRAAIPDKEAVRLIPAMSIPKNSVRDRPPRANRLSCASLGGRSISSFPSFRSTPRARAGRESVIRLIQRIWLDFSGDGRPISTAANMVRISPRLEDSRKTTDFLMFS